MRLTQLPLNDVVAGERNTPSTRLGEASLVDQITNALEVRVAPRDVRLANAQHI